MVKRKTKKKPSKLHQKWIDFGYKHTLLAVLVIIFTILVIDTALIAAILEWFQHQKYIGGFVGGIMLVSSFTAAPAIVLLLSVAQNVDPLALVVIATFGSVLGDWIILKYIEDEIALEMKPIARRLKLSRRIKNIQKRPIRHLVTVIGAFLVMLPTPDEFGLTLMGIGHLKRWKILVICYGLNFIGLYGLITFASRSNFFM